MKANLGFRAAAVALLTLPAVAKGVAVGDPAPPFKLAALSGGDVALSDFAGKVVFINFFGYT